MAPLRAAGVAAPARVGFDPGEQVGADVGAELVQRSRVAGGFAGPGDRVDVVVGGGRLVRGQVGGGQRRGAARVGVVVKPARLHRRPMAFTHGVGVQAQQGPAQDGLQLGGGGPVRVFEDLVHHQAGMLAGRADQLVDDHPGLGQIDAALQEGLVQGGQVVDRGQRGHDHRAGAVLGDGQGERDLGGGEPVRLHPAGRVGGRPAPTGVGQLPGHRQQAGVLKRHLALLRGQDLHQLEPVVQGQVQRGQDRPQLGSGRHAVEVDG